MNEKVLSLRGVTKKYKSRRVVNEVNLDINRGEIVGLIGKNGAGKTTILRMIAGLADSNSGEIELFGKTSKSEQVNERKRMGSLIENPAIYGNMTAKQNLEYYRIQRGITDKESVKNALKLVGLTDTGNKLAKKFSLGMKQKLGIAIAILGSPELLLLDEPINGLDPMAIVQIRELIHKLNRENNTTVLISSHILQEMSMVANKYSFIHDGKILETITAEKLEEKCQLFLKLRVKDVKQTTLILENTFNTENFKVISNEEIHIFDNDLNSDNLMKELINAEIGIISMGEEGQNLEDYFINLIGGVSNE
ncbi:MAG: ABC transporter ATP-binding protein [Tissierellia bacterium]|nr:ABC transporter ATP-binding protein [Tissierellia bacterium]